MMTTALALLFLAQDVPVFGLLPPEQQARLEACNVDEMAFERLMELDIETFDQSFDGDGWRGVAAQEGCEAAAADILEAYILFSRPYADGFDRTVKWHAGQLRASAGETDRAIAIFKGTYDRLNVGDIDAVEWNLYVDATIAFLQDDYDALVAARDELAKQEVSEDEKAARRKFLADNPNIQMPEGFVDAVQNLNVVEGFVTCFGKPYSVAYSRECQPGN